MLTFAMQKVGGVTKSEKVAPIFFQQKPAQFDIFKSEKNIRELAAGYQSVQKGNNSVAAKVK